MIDEATRRKIDVIKRAIAENLQYKDLPEELKEKYDETMYKIIVKKSKEFKKFRHKKAN